MAKTKDGTGGDAGVFLLLGTAVATVTAAFVALIVAGVSIADTFPPGGDVARDTGVFQATLSWATPLALLGIALIFSAVIPLSLTRVRTRIRARRDALVTTLPKLLQHPSTH